MTLGVWIFIGSGEFTRLSHPLAEAKSEYVLEILIHGKITHPQFTL